MERQAETAQIHKQEEILGKVCLKDGAADAGWRVFREQSRDMKASYIHGQFDITFVVVRSSCGRCV